MSVGTNSFLKGTLSIGGVSTLASSLSVSGGTTLSNTLSIGGVSTLANSLSVSSDTTLATTLSVGTNSFLKGTLSIGGASTLASSLSVSGGTTLSTTLSVGGATTLANTLSLGSNSFLNGSLSVSGTTTLSNNLSVSGTITLGSGSNRYTLPNTIDSNSGYALKVPESGNTLEWGEVVSFFTVRDSVDLNPNFTDVRIIEFDSSTGFELSRATDAGNNTISNSVKVSIGSHWKDLVVGSDTLTPSGQESLEFKTGTGISITASSSDTPQSLTIATNGIGTSLVLSQTLSVGGNYLYFDNYNGNDVGIRAHDGTPQFKTSSGNWADISSTVQGASGTINNGSYGKLSFYSTVGTGKVLSSTDNLFWDDSNDRLGIKVSSPTTTLDVDGDATFSGTVTAQEVSSISDIKFKTNINTIKNPIDKILKLRGVSFDWKHNEYPGLSKRKQIGFIAQEMEEVIPEVVLTSEHKTVCYDKLVALLIEGMKEQQNKIHDLENKILSIDNKVNNKLDDIELTFSDHETAITLVNNNLCGIIEDNLKQNNKTYNSNYETYSRDMQRMNRTTIYSV